MSITSEIALDSTKAISQADTAAKEIGAKFDRVGKANSSAAASMAAGSANGGNAGMGLQKIAQFADDAQYGLKGVTNNISDTLMALGAGAGLAGAATIAAVAVQTVLVPALEKLAMGETEVARAARLQAAAELNSAQATRRKAIETKASEKAHTDWAARLASTSDVIRQQNVAIDSNISATQRWNEVRNENAEAKIKASDAPEVTKIKQLTDLETAAAAERVRLDKTASESILANNKKLYEQEQKLFDETQAAIGKARATAKANWSSAAEAGTRGGDPTAYRARAMEADKELATLTAKRDELAKTLPTIKKLYDDANQDFAKAIEAEKMLQLKQETNTLKANEKINQILKDNAKARREEFAKMSDLGTSIAISGRDMNDRKVKDDTKQAQDRQAYDAELQIQSLRAKGHDRQADKLKKEQAIIKETQALVKMGYSDEEAATRARRKADLDNPRTKGSSHRLTAQEMRDRGTRTSHNGIGSADFSGLDKVEIGRSLTGVHYRVGDQNYARLDAMAERQKASEAARAPRITDISKTPKSENNILVDGLANNTKELAALREIIAPLVKKYNASDLNP